MSFKEEYIEKYLRRIKKYSRIFYADAGPGITVKDINEKKYQSEYYLDHIDAAKTLIELDEDSTSVKYGLSVNELNKLLNDKLNPINIHMQATWYLNTPKHFRFIFFNSKVNKYQSADKVDLMSLNADYILRTPFQYLILYTIPLPDREKMTIKRWKLLQNKMVKRFQHPWYGLQLTDVKQLTAFEPIPIIGPLVENQSFKGNRLLKQPITRISKKDFYPGKGCKTLNELLTEFGLRET